MDDVDIIVTAKKSSQEATKLKMLAHKMAPKIVREQLSVYLESMREGMCVVLLFFLVGLMQERCL